MWLYGATLTTIQSDNGRRLGVYSSISWENTRNGFNNEGIYFLFSLDTRKYYKNICGSHKVNHSSSHNPEFGSGNDFALSSGCLNNSSSYSTKYIYGMSSDYELNGDIKNFKA